MEYVMSGQSFEAIKKHMADWKQDIYNKKIVSVDWNKAAC